MNKLILKKEDFKIYVEKDGSYVSTSFVNESEESLSKEIMLQIRIKDSEDRYNIFLRRDEIKTLAELLTDVSNML